MEMPNNQPSCRKNWDFGVFHPQYLEPYQCNPVTVLRTSYDVYIELVRDCWVNGCGIYHSPWHLASVTSQSTNSLPLLLDTEDKRLSLPKRLVSCLGDIPRMVAHPSTNIKPRSHHTNWTGLELFWFSVAVENLKEPLSMVNLDPSNT